MSGEPPAASLIPDLAELTRACEDARRALARARGTSPEDHDAALAALDEALLALARARELLARAERNGGPP